MSWAHTAISLLAIAVVFVGLTYAAPAAAATTAYTCFDPSMQMPLAMAAACGGAF